MNSEVMNFEDCIVITTNSSAFQCAIDLMNMIAAYRIQRGDACDYTKLLHHADIRLCQNIVASSRSGRDRLQQLFVMAIKRCCSKDFRLMVVQSYELNLLSYGTQLIEQSVPHWTLSSDTKSIAKSMAKTYNKIND